MSDLSYHASGATGVCRQLRTGRWTRRRAGAFGLGEVFVPLGHLSFPDASDLFGFSPGQRLAWKH